MCYALASAVGTELYLNLPSFQSLRPLKSDNDTKAKLMLFWKKLVRGCRVFLKSDFFYFYLILNYVVAVIPRLMGKNWESSPDDTESTSFYVMVASLVMTKALFEELYLRLCWVNFPHNWTDFRILSLALILQFSSLN